LARAAILAAAVEGFARALAVDFAVGGPDDLAEGLPEAVALALALAPA